MFSRLLDWNLSGNLCTHSDTADRKCSLQMLTNTRIIIHCKEFRRVYWKCCEKLRLQYKSLAFHGMKSSPCISPSLLLKFQYWKAYHCCTFRLRSTELCDLTGRIKQWKRQEIIIRENHHKVWIQTKAKNWLRKGTKGMREASCAVCVPLSVSLVHQFWSLQLQRKAFPMTNLDLTRWLCVSIFFYSLSIYKIEQGQRHKQRITRTTDTELKCCLHVHSFLRRGVCFLLQKKVWTLLLRCRKGKNFQRMTVHELARNIAKGNTGYSHNPNLF